MFGSQLSVFQFTDVQLEGSSLNTEPKLTYFSVYVFQNEIFWGEGYLWTSMCVCVYVFLRESDKREKEIVCVFG